MTRQEAANLMSSIEQFFAAHKVYIWVTGGVQLVTYIEINIDLVPPTTVDKVESRLPDLQAYLRCRQIRCSNRNGLSLQIPCDPSFYPAYESLLAMSPMSRMNELYALVGMQNDGAPLLINFASPDCCHVLVAGRTGSGKTTLAQSMVMSMVQRVSPSRVSIVVIDPKNRGATPFLYAIRNHLAWGICQQADAIIDVLEMLVARMDEPIVPNPSPRLVVYVDELADLCMIDQRIGDLLTRLAQRGRESGIHLLCCTQKPLAQSIGTLLKANLPLRIVGALVSAEDSKAASGKPKLGAEGLSKREFIVVSGGEDIRIVAPDFNIRIDEATLRGFVPQLHQKIVKDAEFEVVHEDDEDLGIEVQNTPKTPQTVNHRGNGINPSTIAAAVAKLRGDGAVISKTSVLREMGYGNAGGASRLINKYWGEVMK